MTVRDSQRVVVVTRKSALEELVERHGTLGQARFYLKSRGQDAEPFEQAHKALRQALEEVTRRLPAEQRRAVIHRDQLARFLFAPDDLVLVVGQDGLVANASKYLTGQIVCGINPDPSTYDGVLCRHSAMRTSEIMRWLSKPDKESYRIELRPMVCARREDGQELLGLNEIFVGHETHQSARYAILSSGHRERQSSSGLICATGTGATGWARSILEQRKLTAPPPGPEEARLIWFVREPFPSVSTQSTMDFGSLGPGESILLRSEMGVGGVVFADGVESDRLEFLQGHSLELALSDRALNLVVPRSA